MNYKECNNKAIQYFKFNQSIISAVIDRNIVRNMPDFYAKKENKFNENSNKGVPSYAKACVTLQLKGLTQFRF